MNPDDTTQTLRISGVDPYTYTSFFNRLTQLETYSQSLTCY